MLITVMTDSQWGSQNYAASQVYLVFLLFYMISYVQGVYIPVEQCDFSFGLFFRFSFRFRFASYFLVLVSFQFYSIGDFYKYVMTVSYTHLTLPTILRV